MYDQVGHSPCQFESDRSTDAMGSTSDDRGFSSEMHRLPYRSARMIRASKMLIRSSMFRGLFISRTLSIKIKSHPEHVEG
jgi:hypothetical protein